MKKKEAKENTIDPDKLFLGISLAADITYLDAEKRREWGIDEQGADCPSNEELFLRVYAALSRAHVADRRRNVCGLLRVGFDYENSREARDVYREKIKGTFQNELAETLRQLLNLCAGLHIDVESHIREIYKYNNVSVMSYSEQTLSEKWSVR
jgi:hypothetical protein